MRPSISYKQGLYLLKDYKTLNQGQTIKFVWALSSYDPLLFMHCKVFIQQTIITIARVMPLNI